MNQQTFKIERVHAALLHRRTHLQRLLSLKNETAPFKQTQGFVFLIQGGERVRIEDELKFVEGTIALLAHSPE